MFKEKYLINNSSAGGLEGALKKVAGALDPSKSKAETSEKILHSNAESGPWNDEQNRLAKEAEVKIAEETTKTRKDAGEVFLNIPKKWAQKLGLMLLRPPVKLAVKGWTKLTQIPQQATELATSGILIANKTVWNLVDWPARIVNRTWTKIAKVLGESEGGGGLTPAAAH